MISKGKIKTIRKQNQGIWHLWDNLEKDLPHMAMYELLHRPGISELVPSVYQCVFSFSNKPNSCCYYFPSLKKSVDFNEFKGKER